MFQVYKVSNELKNYVSVWEDIVKGGHGHKQWSRSAINNFDIGMNKFELHKYDVINDSKMNTSLKYKYFTELKTFCSRKN